MSTEITDYDTSEYLENEQDIIAYLNAIAEYDDPALMQAALGNVAKARGMTQIAKDAGVWFSTFTINRGTNAGIRENLCAITANGEVVGLVTEVGVNYAVVKTVLDSTLEISGTISTSGYNGMVKGGYVSGNDTLLQMNYLPSESIIRNKDQVVTSGSTVYPRGLIIGSVVDAGYEETGVAKFALLDPAADINSLEQVFIITQYTTEVAITPVTATDSETATAPSETAPSETAAATQATTPVG